MVSVRGQLDLNYVPFADLVDPQTLVTMVPEEARRFYDECRGRVIYKSISAERSIVRPLAVVVVLDRTRLNRLRGDWKTRLEVGRRTHLSTELYQPLDTADKLLYDQLALQVRALGHFAQKLASPS